MCRSVILAASLGISLIFRVQRGRRQLFLTECQHFSSGLSGLRVQVRSPEQSTRSERLRPSRVLPPPLVLSCPGLYPSRITTFPNIKPPSPHLPLPDHNQL